MTFLILSVVSYAAMMLIFKLIERFKADTFQSIIFNYITAAVLGFTVMDNDLSATNIIHANWFPNAVLIGFAFISLFYLIAITAQKAGVSVATVANKMSVIIPIIFAFFLYNDSVTFIKISGIVLAFVGVYMATKKEVAYAEENPDEINLTSAKEKDELDKKYLYLPVILFIGSGFLDTYINYTQKHHLTGAAESIDFVPVVFSVAAITGGIILLVKFIISSSIFAFRNILWGMLLGLFSYFSLYFMLESLNLNYFESSVIFTINNIGIVSLSTLASYVFFKEYLSRINKTGIVLCLIAILLISFS